MSLAHLPEYQFPITIRALRSLGLGFLTLLAGCAPGDFSYQKRLDGPYLIRAIDDLSDMSVCYNRGHGGSGCHVLVEPTVFEVGWDARYIVAARHPADNPTSTTYYYIDRTVEDLRDATHGPFSDVEFAAETRRLSLPPMTRRAPFIYCSGERLCSPLSDVFK
jgi:hypothetical protein